MNNSVIMANMDWTLKVNSKMTIFLVPVLKHFPLLCFKGSMYFEIAWHFSRKTGWFCSGMGAFLLVQRDFYYSDVKKNSSSFFVKSDVGLVPANVSKTMPTFRESKAQTTEAHNAWGTTETHLLWFLHKICFPDFVSKKEPKILLNLV